MTTMTASARSSSLLVGASIAAGGSWSASTSSSPRGSVFDPEAAAPSSKRPRAIIPQCLPPLMTMLRRAGVRGKAETQYNVRFYNSLLSCHEVRTKNPYASDLARKRIGSLPPTCGSIELTGESTDGLPEIWKILGGFAPVEFRLVTSNPAIVTQFLDFWEAHWPQLRSLSLFTVMPAHPSARKLLMTLTKLHMYATGNSQVLYEVMSMPNALRILKLRRLLDVPAIHGALKSVHCHIASLSLLDTACLSEVLGILHCCETLRVLEVDGIQSNHLDQICDLVDAGKFPEITELIVQRRSLAVMRDEYEELKARVRAKRDSLVLISAGVFV